MESNKLEYKLYNKSVVVCTNEWKQPKCHCDMLLLFPSTKIRHGFVGRTWLQWIRLSRIFRAPFARNRKKKWVPGGAFRRGFVKERRLKGFCFWNGISCTNPLVLLIRNPLFRISWHINQDFATCAQFVVFWECGSTGRNCFGSSFGKMLSTCNIWFAVFFSAKIIVKIDPWL